LNNDLAPPDKPAPDGGGPGEPSQPGGGNLPPENKPPEIASIESFTPENAHPEGLANRETAPHYAGFARRGVAMGIDCVIIAAFVYFSWVTALWLTDESDLFFYFSMAAFSFILPFVYFVFFISKGGQTPGKMVVRIKVVEQSGAPAGFSRAVFRVIGYSFSFFFMMGGFLWAFVDGRRQGWHDKIAGTVVLEI
jgi:uncharacterized RDD family membrane protein YckC